MKNGVVVRVRGSLSTFDRDDSDQGRELESESIVKVITRPSRAPSSGTGSQPTLCLILIPAANPPPQNLNAETRKKLLCFAFLGDRILYFYRNVKKNVHKMAVHKLPFETQRKFGCNRLLASFTAFAIFTVKGNSNLIRATFAE